MDRAKIENDLLNAGLPAMQSEALSYLFAETATKEDIRELRSEMKLLKTELLLAIGNSNTQIMEAFVSFQNKLFTHVLALIGVLTAIITLIELLMR